MPAKAHTLGPGALTIGPTGEKEFGAQLTKCLLTPKIDTDDDLHVLSGETIDGEDTITWELSGTLLQDYDLDSLEDYCFEHTSEKLAFSFIPNNANERLYTGVVKIRPIAVGGEVKKRNTSDFTFPLVGAPTPGHVD